MKKILLTILFFLSFPLFSYATTLYDVSDNSGDIDLIMADYSTPVSIGSFQVSTTTSLNGGSIWFFAKNPSGPCGSSDWFHLTLSTTTSDVFNNSVASTSLFPLSTSSDYILYKQDWWNSGLTGVPDVDLVPGYTYYVYPTSQCNFGSSHTLFKSNSSETLFTGLIFDGDGFSEQTFVPTYIKEILSPQSGDNFIDVATTTFSYSYYYNVGDGTLPVYDMAFAQLKNNKTGDVRYLVNDVISQLSGTYIYSAQKDLLTNSSYQWRPVLRNSSDLTVPDIYGPWVSFYNFDSASSTGPLLIDSTGYTPYDLSLIPTLATTTGVTSGFCERLPFAYFCDIYSAIVGLDPTPLSTSTPILTLRLASSTAELTASTSFNSIANIDFITPATLQYFFPDNVALIFRTLIMLGLWLGFGYYVWSQVSSLIKIQL